jgi:uncharacterized protein YcfJ
MKNMGLRSLSSCVFCLILLMMMSFSGCSKQEKGAATGAGVGAVAGTVIGAAAGRGSGALVGGLAGAAIGGIAGAAIASNGKNK